MIRQPQLQLGTVVFSYDLELVVNVLQKEKVSLFMREMLVLNFFSQFSEILLNSEQVSCTQDHTQNFNDRSSEFCFFGIFFLCFLDDKLHQQSLNDRPCQEWLNRNLNQKFSNRCDIFFFIQTSDHFECLNGSFHTFFIRFFNVIKFRNIIDAKSFQS
jgi:hypothetical protein